MSVLPTNSLAMEVSAASEVSANRPLAAANGPLADDERVLIHAERAVNASEVRGQERACLCH